MLKTWTSRLQFCKFAKHRKYVVTAAARKLMDQNVSDNTIAALTDGISDETAAYSFSLFTIIEVRSQQCDFRYVFQQLPEPNRACLVGVW